MDRRTFLTAVGRLVVIVPAGYAFASCGGDGGAGGTYGGAYTGSSDAGSSDAGEEKDASASAAMLRFTSSRVNSHTHEFELAVASLDSPPSSGISGATSETLGHEHEVSLSQQQLEDIAGGGTVTVETSLAVGHTHTRLPSVAELRA